MKQIYLTKSMKSLLLALSFSMFCFIMPAASQSAKLDSILNKISIGIKTGINFPTMQYSDPELAEYKSSLFPRGVSGLFVEIALTPNVSVRPEIGFMGKGQKINDIGVTYKFKSNYLGLCLPVLYNFKTKSSFQPYALVGPTLGFAAGGKIELDYWRKGITNASISSTDFGLMLGCGAKYPLKLKNYTVLLGTEVTYDYVFSDTYSKKEIDETAIALNKTTYSIDGTRKNRGLSITASLSIPFRSIFPSHVKKEKPAIVEEIIILPEIIPPVKEPELPQKDCYTIDEMISYLNKGFDVNDKKICLYTINFETAKSTLDKTSKTYLDQIVSLLENFATTKMKINGHTDNVGSEDYNIKLSEDRALAVYNYLISKGAFKERLSFAFYGTKYPISPNDTEEGRAKNRRVEFEVKNEIVKSDTTLKSEVKKQNSGISKNNSETSSIGNKDERHSFSPENHAKEFYDRATEKLNAGDKVAAIDDFSKAITLNSNYADAFNDRGVAYLQSGKYTSAIHDFKMCLKINPQMEVAEQNLKIAKGKRSERTMLILSAVSTGLNAASSSINAINGVNATTTATYPTNISTPSNKSNGHLERVTCTYCKGIKVSSYPSQGTCFGIESYHLCETCNKTVPCSHGPHLSCIPCQGKGYTEKYIP